MFRACLCTNSCFTRRRIGNLAVPIGQEYAKALQRRASNISFIVANTIPESVVETSVSRHMWRRPSLLHVCPESNKVEQTKESISCAVPPAVHFVAIPPLIYPAQPIVPPTVRRTLAERILAEVRILHPTGTVYINRMCWTIVGITLPTVA